MLQGCIEGSASQQTRPVQASGLACMPLQGCMRLYGFKRVIVYDDSYTRRLPALIEFLHVDIQSTGHKLSRPWSRQLNDVMSEIECAQLHSELFRRIGTAHGSRTVSLR